MFTIGDSFNNRVRKVNAAGIITTVAGGGGVASNFGDGGLATNASLALPMGMRVDSAGNVYIAEIATTGESAESQRQQPRRRSPSAQNP